MSPLVTILIATRDRPDDVRRTLLRLRHQSYREIELLVIDDGSLPRLERIVREAAPDATYIYREQSAGQSKRRSEGFAIAKGKYILQLDDDSWPVHPEALYSAVKVLEERPEVGILSFQIFNGERLPDALPVLEARYHSSFVGCGALIRSIVVTGTGGYRSFFGNEWEEPELSLRVMKAGYAIFFLPEVVIHHDMSPHNRLTARTWMRGFRNKLWAIVMHFPARRLPLEMSWVVAIAAFDAVRLLRVGVFAQGIREFFQGLPRVRRLRDPMSNLVLRRYDAMRFGTIQTSEQYSDPPALSIKSLMKWFRGWRDRPRQRSFWDRRPGDVGTSETVRFTHEFPAHPPERKP
jgi:GT2 family glycosyltransferase